MYRETHARRKATHQHLIPCSFQQRKWMEAKPQLKFWGSLAYQLGRALCLQVPMTFCFLFQTAVVPRPLLQPSSVNTSCFVTGVKDKDSPSGERGEDEGRQLLLPVGKFVFPFSGLRTQDLCASRWRSAPELWWLLLIYWTSVGPSRGGYCVPVKDGNSSIYLWAVFFTCLINFTL